MRAFWSRWLEWFLTLVGVACLAYWGWVTFASEAENAYQSHRLDLLIQHHESSTRGTTALPARLPGENDESAHAAPSPSRDPLIGRIDIPSVGVSSVILEGDDAATLRHAVGHIPGTAIPGDAGNAALAGHRDSYFRGLRHIKPDDVITITRPDGTYRYVVESTEVVDPGQVQVLAPTRDPRLTLVTCYPFSYIGPAPHRFIVVARRADEGAPSLPRSSAGVAE